MNAGLRWSCVALIVCVVVGCGPQLPVDVAPNIQTAEKLRTDIDAGGGAAVVEKGLVDPTGWATLTGKVILKGTPPAEEPLKMSGGDIATCAPGGKVPTAGTIEVAADGGLANVLFFLTTEVPAGDAKWEHPDYAAKKDATLETPFDQKSCRFLSRIYAMRATQTLVVKNSDPVGHNAKIEPKTAKQDNFTIPGGQSANYKPGKGTKEPFPVSCAIHPWMKAWLISRDNPYFAVTDNTGAFKIENLPAAEGLKLKFRAWHERSAFASVKVNGEDQAWKKGAFEWELKPGETTNLEITIDVSQIK